MANTNVQFGEAKKGKKDEFYTQLVDIENELRHYKEYFNNKVVLCNCDDPRISNFFRYFALNFEALGLKKLIATCYKNCEPDIFSLNDCEQAVYIVYEGDKNGNKVPDPEEMQVLPLKGNGDFRSEECIELLKEADIVCTNPPFSLFQEYILQLVQYNKHFIVMGTMNAIHYTEIFPLIEQNKIWAGYTFNKTLEFELPNSYTKYKYINDKGNKVGTVAGIIWLTNLPVKNRERDITPYKHYSPEEYDWYDNCNAIDVPKVSDIPVDFDGIMGVPDSFLEYYDPEKYELLAADCIPQYADKVGISRIGEEWMARYRAAGGTGHYTANMRSLVLTTKDGIPKKVFSRLLIRKKQ